MALVRLRPRPRRSPEPKGPFDAWTTVGNLDSPARAMVDPSGRLAVVGQGWVLDWWIGAEDRWHQPASEAAVRQHLVGASPVVETRVKVPSGDAVGRSYGARGPSGEDLVVLEVENASRVPFALAVVVRAAPHGQVHSVRLEGSSLLVDDQPALHLARAPGRIAMSTAADPVDAGDIVLSGDAEPVRVHEVRCPDGGAQAVLLFPLAHTASLRAAVPMDQVIRPVDPAALPSAVQVASGWATHSRGGARIEVPDRRLREAIAASTRALLLDGAGAAVARALLQLGFPAEARRREARSTEAEVGEALAVRAEGWRLHREALADDEVLALAGLVERWARTAGGDQLALGRAALPAVADLLDASGEPRAAADVRTLAREASDGREPRALADLYALVADAGATFSWARPGSGPDPEAAARFLLATRAHLVDDDGEGLVLSPLVPEPWLGQGWEVHDLPTAHGALSFAIRWHGERPALLWELDRRGDDAVRLTCGLDRSWSTREAAGEALLRPVAVPERPRQRRGLTIPVTIEPGRRRA